MLATCAASRPNLMASIAAENGMLRIMVHGHDASDLAQLVDPFWRATITVGCTSDGVDQMVRGIP